MDSTDRRYPSSEYFPGQNLLTSTLSHSASWASDSYAAARAWASGTPTNPPSPIAPPAPAAPSSKEQSKPKSQVKKTPPVKRTFEGTTTFTFLLFGLSSTAVIAYVFRTQRAMNRVQATSSLAYRDARAWRKVALNLAKLDAVAPNRVAHLVPDVFKRERDGAHFDSELDAARRAVKERRAAVQRADAEAARSKSLAIRSGFSFNNHAPNSHKPVPDTATEARAQSVKTSCNSTKTLSARDKWARVAGISHATAQPPAPTAALKWKTMRKKEDWIGDVDKAIKQRDSASSQVEQEEEEDWLLPCSDLNIATGRQFEDELGADAAAEETVTPAPAPTYSYPISDTYKDMEDLLMAGWDDGFGLTASVDPAPSDSTTGKTVKTGPVTESIKAVPVEQSVTSTAVKESVSSAPVKQPTSPKIEDSEVESEIPVHWLRARDIADDLARDLKERKPTQASPQFDATGLIYFDDYIDAELRSSAPSTKAEVGSSKPSTTEITAKDEAGSRLLELTQQLQAREEELVKHRSQLRDLRERVETLQDTCYELEDESKRRNKALKGRIGDLEHHIGLLSVWADGIHRRLGLEPPPVFKSRQ